MSLIQVEEIQDSIFDAEGCDRDKQTHEKGPDDRRISYRTLNRAIAERHRRGANRRETYCMGQLYFSWGGVDEHGLKNYHDANDNAGEAVRLPDEVEDLAVAKAEHLCGCR